MKNWLCILLIVSLYSIFFCLHAEDNLSISEKASEKNNVTVNVDKNKQVTDILKDETDRLSGGVTMSENVANSLSDDENVLLQTLGWIIAHRSGLVRIALSYDELKTIFDGISAAIGEKQPPVDPDKIAPQIQNFIDRRAEEFQIEKKRQLKRESINNQELAQDFYKKLRENPRILETQSGLYYEMIDAGTIPRPDKEDSVVLKYEGTLIDGSVFDSSKERGNPVTFSISNLIPGFQEGIQLIGTGGRIKLYIPPELGYADRDIPGIPPGSTLIFDVELIQVITSRARVK